MKKIKSIAIFIALVAMLIPFSLSACSNADTSSPTDTAINSTEGSTSANTPSIDLDSYEEQIAYYMALSESLKKELLILKEEKYVESCEKDLRIAELEETVSSLQKAILSMSEPDKDNLYPSFDQIVSKQDFEYTVSGEEIIITGYIGVKTAVTVPSEINGLSVREIADGAFKGSDIVTVSLPSSLRKIGWFAFEGCADLESVSIPSSVSSIGYGAFNACPSSLKVICEEGSYAESFAQSWGIGVTLK